MEFWLWMPQLFACTRARIKTQINRGLSPIILDLARQAAVLAVDEHGDQGWIWLGDGENSFSSLP